MSSSEIKQKAKEMLDGKKGKAAVMLIIFSIVEAILNAITGAIFPGETTEIMEGIKVTSQSPIAGFISSFVGVFLLLGLTSYFMKIARGEDPEFTELFSKGNIFIKAFLSAFVAGLLICVGFIALIIPGIILAYAYTMINYIYIDNPETGIIDAVRQSRVMMKGHKFQLFCLWLSFLGWIILGLFTFGLLYLWLLPYMQVSQAVFYDSIKDAA